MGGLGALLNFSLFGALKAPEDLKRLRSSVCDLRAEPPDSWKRQKDGAEKLPASKNKIKSNKRIWPSEQKADLLFIKEHGKGRG